MQVWQVVIAGVGIGRGGGREWAMGVRVSLGRGAAEALGAA